MQGDWDKLKKQFADAPNVVIAEADCAGAAKSYCGEHQVQGYPSLKLIINGKTKEYNGARSYDSLKREVETKLNPKPACSLESRDACSPADRTILEESEKMTKSERSAKIKEVEKEVKDKKQQAVDLEKEAKRLAASLDLIKAGGQTVEKVEQLLNDADMKAHCEDRTCVVAFLPHILDDQAAGRKEKLKILDECLKAAKKDGKSVGYVWSQGGDQFEAEEQLGLQFGFPAVIAINLKKNRIGVHRGIFDKSSVSQFLLSLGRGGVPLSPLPPNFKFAKADPWDGKDGKLPEEEEL